MFEFTMSHPRAGVLLVRLSGELTDGDRAEQLKSLLVESGANARLKVLLDFGRVNAVEASGLGFLMSLAGALAAQGTGLAIVSPAPAVRRSLDFAGVKGVIPVFEDITHVPRG